MRQIILDTETTGFDPKQGDRLVEIGCVEMIDRKITGKTYHQYVNPQRDVPEDAIAIHGITNEFLEDKPIFSQVADDFFNFVKGAELIIHNAPFDLGFLDFELNALNRGYPNLASVCSIIDTLVMAREMRPGQRNTLDALAKEYPTYSVNRDLHGALLDSEILAYVYLAMTGGQKSLELASSDGSSSDSLMQVTPIDRAKVQLNLPVHRLTPVERQAHYDRLEAIKKASGGIVVFEDLGSA